MTTNAQHTPGPWHLLSGKLRPQFSAEIVEIRGKGKTPIVSWAGFDDSARPLKEHLANAAFIVQACNSFDDLLAAAEQAIHDLEDMSSNPYAKGLRRIVAGNLRAAIAKAKGR